ncbi:hypothetical protein [Schleiferilactobacillus shenzhenensis]|uniref:hypothetical protein n=1 Tax=Schleiferilactobacillus shenzhenensis TaxID=1231337 RepID=UPI0012DF167F|nr:hypothetical protein [Schleiferilactobacillus shenzhenensis]
MDKFKDLSESEQASISGGSKHDYDVWYEVGQTVRNSIGYAWNTLFNPPKVY